MSYTARVVFITVHHWTDEFGQGEHACNKGGYRIGDFPTLQHALAEVSEQFGKYEVNENGFVQVSLIEDADAQPDPKGDYIADYDIIIERVERVGAEELKAA
tara:strand:- start:364 stop:669 length:306 start_codon:yes stop_codon:yes gene_type:complete